MKLVLSLLFALLAYIPQTYTLDLKSANAVKPLIPRPVGSKYKILVGTDGGGLKATIQAVVLVKLEDIIKEHILADAPELLPTDFFITSINDFEVSLADYVDCFAGASAGSWVASYLASKGGNGASQNILKEKRFIEKYGEIAPTSAKGLLVLFLEFGNTIYPQHLFDEGGIPTSIDPTVPGVASNLLATDGTEQVLKTFLGDTKMSELQTSCLIPVFDIVSRQLIVFLHDALTENSQYGYATFVHRNGSHPVGVPYQSEIEVTLGQDFLLRTVSLGSSAAPVVLPAVNISSVSGFSETFLVTDGFLALNNPTLFAVSYIKDVLQLPTLEHIAVISIGTGHTFANYADNAFGGTLQWLASGELLNLAAMLTTDILSATLDLLFHANPNGIPGQYMRVQPFGETETRLGNLLAGGTDSTAATALQNVGDELALEYEASFRAFVKNFMFPS